MPGALYNQYGIKELVDGFNMLQNDEIQLHLYGQGDAVEYIESIAKQNKNIKYMGVKPNDEIIIAEKKAILLINPRPTIGEFTKYSFPSKTMEYMLTGTPVLMTKLPGLPLEYFEYVYFIEEESVNGIRDSINNIIKNLTAEELNQKGKKAQKFIRENKNNEIQGRRIIQLIYRVMLGERQNDK